jgi:hypothetical protein
LHELKHDSNSRDSLGLADNAGAMGNHAVVGIVVAALAAMELWLVHRRPPRVPA